MGLPTHNASPASKEETGGEAAPNTADGESSGSAAPRSPLEHQVGDRASAPSNTGHYESPEAVREQGSGVDSSSSSRSRSRAMRSWKERDGRNQGGENRGPGTGPQDHLFSPPPYKTDKFATSDLDPSQPPPVATMGQVEGREFDQLDLNVDITGPDDPLMLGASFSEESPPRMPDGRRSPSVERDPSSDRRRPSQARPSPAQSYPYQQPYHPYPRRSPDAGREGYQVTTPSQTSRRDPPHQGYSFASYPPQGSPPGYGAGSRSSPKYYSSYSPYNHYPPEPYLEAAHAFSNPYDLEDEIPPLPPSSTKKQPSDPAASPNQDTPEKVLKSRSPFRSPPQSAVKPPYRRSPHLKGSPAIRPFGSFEFYPNPGDFSPMPPFQDIENVPFDANSTPDIRRREHNIASPMSALLNGLSPYDGGLTEIARSPPAQQGYDEPSSRERHPPKPAVTDSPNRHHSKMHTPHGSVKKTLWPRDPPGSGVRLEIGSHSIRKRLDGINSRMQSRNQPRDNGTPANRPEAYHRGLSQQQHRPPHYPGGFRHDITTPIKPGSQPYPHRTTPSSGRHRMYPSSASKYPPSSHKDYPPSTSKSHYAPPQVPPSMGKENKKKAASPKRSPCNCKKSKCLKLYCECFAAERFCQDCNCTDCGNTPTAGAIRDKAIKDTRAKNPNAFKPRFSVKNAPTSNSPQSGHNMGCRCKRSECLKKYCECFQAGVICGPKCKCVDCLNFAGSQALIDKRRKIKDQRGADFAMRVADEAWKQGRGGAPRKPIAPTIGSASRRPPHKAGAPGHMAPPHLTHPSPRGVPPPHAPPHHYGMPPYMRGPPPGYPHQGMPMTPAGYPPYHHQYHPHMPPGESPHGMYPPSHAHHRGHPPSSTRSDLKRPAPMSVTPGTATPRARGERVKFDPASSRKKRKISPGKDDVTLPFFGNRFPEQPKTTALAIFSFLSNDDLYNAGLVCRSWSQLAMDGELWKFDGPHI